MSDSQSMHIRHQVTPDYVREMLDVFGVVGESDTITPLMATAEELGLNIGTFTSERGTFADILEVMRKMGIVQKFCATDKSAAVRKVYRHNRSLLSELFHFVLFTGAWTKQRDGIHWGYRRVCALLWQSAPTIIDRQRIAGQVMDDAAEHLGFRPAYSVNSVDGVLNWLRALEPPVIREEGALHFERRGFCPPELLLLGIDDLYRKQGVGYQSNLPLDTEARQYLLELCMLEPESLERVLSWCTSQFDILTADSRGAGPFALLKRPVTLDDLCA
jgi:hypothetical protein